MVRTRCPKIPSPEVVGILVALALSWTRSGWMVSKVEAMLGECMARIFFDEKVPSTSKERASGILAGFVYACLMGGWRLLVLEA